MLLRRLAVLLASLALLAPAACRQHESGASKGDGSPLGSVAAPAPRPPPISRSCTRPTCAVAHFLTHRGKVGWRDGRPCVDRVKLEGPPVLQFDAGDLLPPTDEDVPASEGGRERRVHVLLASYRRMGVDAMTLGELELDLGVEGLRSAISNVGKEFPAIVAANVLGPDGAPSFAADQLLKAGDTAVGVFGIVEAPASTGGDGGHAAVHTADAAEAARAAVQSLRARGARLVVGLFHVAGGLARTREILDGCPRNRRHRVGSR